MVGVVLVLGTSCAVRTQGTSRFEVLGMPEARAVAGAEGGDVQPGTEEIDYIPAQPLRPLEKPAYPESALRTGADDFVLTVVITIDGDGRVTDVERSWKNGVSFTDAHGEAFLAAVRDAVSRWSLQGARQVYYRRSASGEREYLRTEKVQERVEMRFTFERRELPN